MESSGDASFAAGPAWLRDQHDACPSVEIAHSRCEGTGPTSVCPQCCSEAKRGPVRSCGCRRWQELIRFPHSLIYSSQAPCEGDATILPIFRGRHYLRPPVGYIHPHLPVHMPNGGHAGGLLQVSGECQEQGPTKSAVRGWGRGELKEVSVAYLHPRIFSAQHRVWHREHPLNTWLVKEWHSRRNKVDSSGAPKACPSCVPGFLQSLATLFSSLCLPASRAFSRSPRMPQAPTHCRAFTCSYHCLDYPPGPCGSPWPRAGLTYIRCVFPSLKAASQVALPWV